MSLVVDMNPERLGLPELAVTVPAYPVVLVDFDTHVGAFAERFKISDTAAAALVLRACGLSHAEVATELKMSEDMTKVLILDGIRECVESSKRLEL